MKRIFKALVDQQYQRQNIIRLYLLIKRKRNVFAKILLLFLYNYILSSYNIIISMKATVGENLSFPHPMNIIIGRDCIIGDNCTIYHDVTLGQSRDKFPKLGNHVIVYAGAKIMGNVKIGNNAIIGANAVVVKDVMDNQIVGGVPAKVIGVNSDGKEFY